jgi:CspA family cold shock protein
VTRASDLRAIRPAPASRGLGPIAVAVNAQPKEHVKMASGVVKWFDENRGYGFILEENGADVFVHCSGIIGDERRTLKEGDQVVFEIQTAPKGPAAVDVMVV